MTPLELGRSDLSLNDVVEIAVSDRPVAIADAALERAAHAAAFVRDQARAGRVIYGVTTGFGANSNKVIAPEQMHRLQANLLRSHACGVGPPLPRPIVRAMMVLRINGLLTTHSGAHPETLQTLVALLNAALHPVVPSKGSVGASGDLCPLAHMSLPLIGEGQVMRDDGSRLDGAAALAAVDRPRRDLGYKEGIALLNGTQVQTALGVIATHRAQRLVSLADAVCAMSLDALCGRIDALDPRLQSLRRHDGQCESAARMRWWLADSELAGCDPESLGIRKFDRVQDPYSLRCAPQVHGATRGVIEHVESLLSREINAVTDNPILFPESGDIISGGNFHGEPVAMALDYLKLGVAELANISDRRSFKLLTPSLNEGLPAFLVDSPGLESGMMILQYVSAALVSENKVLAHPSSVDSIPTSANQEDLVAMGCQAGTQLLAMIDNVERALAIELIIAAQALEMREQQTARRAAPRVRMLFERVRDIVPFLDTDRSLSDEIERVVQEIVRGPRPLIDDAPSSGASS